MKLSVFCALQVAALALGFAAIVSAQTAPARPARPYRGLFGGYAADDDTGAQKLDFTFLAEGNYDDNLGAALESGPPGTYQGSGHGLGAMGTVDYRRGRSSRLFTASAQSGIRNFHDDNVAGQDVNVVHDSATAGFNTNLGRNTTLTANQYVSYDPYYSLRDVPIYTGTEAGLPPAVGVDYALRRFESLHYGTSLGLDRALGRRSSLRLSYTFAYTDFRHETEDLRDFDSQSAAVTFARDVSRTTELTGTYGYQRGNYGYTAVTSNQLYENHEALVGVRHERRLSPTRTLFLAGAIGATMSYAPNPEGVREGFDGGTGNASFGIDLARSWALRADYHRGVTFREGFTQPFYSNRGTVTVTGYLTRAWMVATSGGYDSGEVSFSGQRNYETYLAQVQTQYALNRHMALTGTYFFYKYLYDESVVLPEGLPRLFDRRGVRVSVVFWVPLLR